MTLWARRSAWVDEAVVGCFKQKLLANTICSAWKQAIDETQQAMKRERKLKRLQLGSLSDEMQNLVISLKTLTHPTLIQEVEQRYTRMEQEKQRLEKELATLDVKRQKHVSLEQAHALFEHAVLEWDRMSQDERKEYSQSLYPTY